MSGPLMPTYPAPAVTFASGSGSWLTDTDGRRYLDLFSGLAVTSLGHAHPEIAEILAAQGAKLIHVSNLFGSEPGPRAARRLDGLLGGGGQVFWCNSGAEANEAAVKLARRFAGPGRAVVVATWGGFHGRTLGALAATGQPQKQEPFVPLPEGFRHAVYGDISDLERQLDESVAAVLVEPIQGEAGVVSPPGDYLAELRRLCDERGMLLICDEVQTGLGRTGEWFGFAHSGVVPDVVCLAKALGNGVPVGACWARSDVAAAFRPGDHATTFGGGPLVTAVVERVLEIMEREDVPGRARAGGERLAAGLAAIEGVSEVRGAGLLLAAELSDAAAPEVVSAGLEAGVVVNAVTPSAIRLAPSLLIGDDEIDAGLEMLQQAISSTRGATP